MFSFMALNQSHFYKNFQGFTYCSVFKVLICRSPQILIFYNFLICRTLFSSRLLLSFFIRSVCLSLKCLSILPHLSKVVNYFFQLFSFCVLGFAVCRQSLSSVPSVSTARHTIFVSSGSEKAVERMLVIRQPFSRRRRDLNPRAATNDLLPFQGSPFNHLGTSALVESHPISGSI